MADEVDRLQAGDVDVIPRLVELKDEAIRELLDQTERDRAQIPQLLKQLGAETYKQRIEAVRKLTLMGRKVYDPVTRYREANQEDPEIVYRANQVLESTSQEAQIENQTAIIRFLVACGDLPAEVLLPFSDDFRAVLEDADHELTTSKSIPPETYRQFIRHLTLLPDLQKPMIDALLKSPHGKETMTILKELLEQDFKKYFPMIIGKNRYSSSIEELIDREFEDRLGDRELRLLLVELLKESKYKLDFKFKADTPITPERAYAILNMKRRKSLGTKMNDLLFDKLALMPNEELLERLWAKPIEKRFILSLARRRKDLHEDLSRIVLHHSSTITRWPLWKTYAFMLERRLNYKIAPGELDDNWARMILLHPLPRLMRRAEALKISPARIVEVFSHPEIELRQKISRLIHIFRYVLVSGDADTRAQAVELLMPDANWQKTLYPSEFRKLLMGLFRHRDPGLVEEKLQLVGKLDSNSKKSIFEDVSKLAPMALEFYRANQAAVDRLWEQQPTSHSSFVWAVIIASSMEQFTTEEQIRLRAAFDASLETTPRPERDACAITIVGMLLGSNSPRWQQVAFEHMADPDIYPDVPFWLLNERHAELIPLIESKLKNEETRHLAYLRAGLMIRPDHPAWIEWIDRWLHAYVQTETIADLFATLNVLGREPDLSRLPPSRLKELFQVNSRDELLAVNDLANELNRPANKNVVLKQLVPQLKEVFDVNWSRSRRYLLNLVGENPAAWDLAGGAMLRMLQSADQKTQRSANKFLQAFEPGSPDGLKEIAECLENGSVDSWIQNSLMWVVAKHGQEAAWMIDVVRKYPADTQFSKRRKSLAVAAISPDHEERRNALASLLDSHRKKPGWKILYEISRVRGFDDMTRPFVREAVEKRFWATKQTTYRFTRSRIRSEMSNFPEPELARILYRDVLEEMAAPGPKKEWTKSMFEIACLRLSHQLVDDLPEFRELLNALPPSAKTQRHYRMVMERMPETDG